MISKFKHEKVILLLLLYMFITTVSISKNSARLEYKFMNANYIILCL